MKKTYSLALWWWAARWLAHIGVIKYLEENNIEINEVSGTSMWSIIWAMFAIWKTSEEITDFAKSVNYFKLLDIDLVRWIVKWKKVLKKLEEVFWDEKIENLEMKLKIVATNIESWEKKVFEKWSIVDAVRSSISLPWVFTPYEIGDNKYVDWGISSNLPIEVLSWKNVIAVSALKKVDTPLKTKRKLFWASIPRWFFNLNFQILQRTILLMMKQNEDRSINTPNKEIKIIYPDYWDNLDFYSFDKVEDMVQVGYKKAKRELSNQL
jgi:predicted acylesterase/phospholipase RssA